MRLALPACAALAWLLSACSTPYRPPVVVAGGHDFEGVAKIVADSGGSRVDVVLVHGMCTQKDGAFEKQAKALAERLNGVVLAERDKAASEALAVPEIARRTLPLEIFGKTVHVTGLLWGRLTTTLKEALLYDNTGAPTDCSVAGECKPVRARLNGQLKDGLMNDCLADALIYQGAGKGFMQEAMAAAIGAVLDGARTQAARDGQAPGPLIIVTESLGSKITFDALDLLHGRPGPTTRDDLGRIAAVFMAANQLPILHLAELSPGDARAQSARAARAEALAPLLRVLRPGPLRPLAAGGAKPIPVVAFTDPNDLLSYRLAAAGLDAGNVRFTDVLVSNAPTWLGYVEHPWIAHTTYLENDDVIELIACGRPRSSLCKPR